MAENVVGEVRVKVRPDATGFRRETDNDVDDALRGVRAEVPIDGKLRVDRNKVQRQLDAARAKLRGGDVKITAKIELPVADAYKEWAKAAEEVKRTIKQLAVLDDKYRGGNRKLNDPIREQLIAQKQSAEELRKVYEDLSANKALIQHKENKRLLADETTRAAATETEKARLADLTSSHLWAEKKRLQASEDSALHEAEIARRRFKMFSQSGFDYLSIQEKNNRQIERENVRHQLAMANRKSVISQISDADLSQEYLQMEPTDDKYMQMSDQEVAANFQRIRDEADKTSKHIDGLHPQLKVEPVGIMAAAAQMQWASRPRQVPFYVTIDAKSYAIATGMLKALAGLGVTHKLGQIAEDVLVNFDKFALKAGTVAVAAGGLVSALGWVGTSSVTVAADLLALSGGLLAVPAALAGLTANMVIHTAAFKDFADAVDGDNKALAKLPDNAQKAAKSLRGLWDEMAKPIQENFWEGMGDEFSKTVEQLAPKFTKGLAESATHIGTAWGEVGKAMRELDDRGDLQKMLDNMTLGFDNAVGAAHPLAEALNIIGLRGTEQLPRFGGWVTEIATGFRDWAKEADNAGKLTEWMLVAEETVGHVGSVTWDAARAFKALADVSLASGSDGLRGMADGMDRIADTMSSEPWQTNMVVLLSGARRGAAELNDGFLDLSNSVGDASVHFGRMLDLLGQLGGEVFTSVAIVVDNEGFQDGSTVAVEGMLKMTRDLAPAFDDLGTILGVFSRVGGAVFANVGGLIGDVIGLAKDLALTLEDNLIGLVPILGDNLRLLVDILGGPLEATFGVLNKMLGVFNDLPGPIQTAVLALAGLVAMRGSIGSLLGMFGTKAKNALSGLTAEAVKQPGILAPLKTAWREQLAVVDKLNPATMRYATSVELMGRGRATLGHAAIAWERLKTITDGYTKVASPMPAAQEAIAKGFRTAAVDVSGFGRQLERTRVALQPLKETFKEGFLQGVGGTGVLEDLRGVKEKLGEVRVGITDTVKASGELATQLPTHFKVGMLQTGDSVKDAGRKIADFTRDAGVALRELPQDVRVAAQMMDSSFKEMIPESAAVRLTAFQERVSDSATAMGDRVLAGAATVGVATSDMVGRVGESVAVMGDRVLAGAATVGVAGSNIAGHATRASSAVGTAVGAIGTAAGSIGRGFQSAGTVVGGAVGGMVTNISRIGTAAAQAGASLGSAAGSSLKSGAIGLTDALGGPWGLAIGGAIALIGMFAAKNAAAQQKVESLTGAMDEQTGALNADGIKQIANAWTDLDEVGDGFANMTRGAKAANETMKQLGVDLGDVTNLIVAGGDDFSSFTGHLDKIAAFKATEAFGFDKTAVDIKSMEEAARGSASALGINWDSLKDISGADLSHAITNIKQEEAALRLSEEAWKGVAEAQGQTSGEAKLLSSAMKSIGDESVAAADKIGAIRTSLDVLQGGLASAREAEMAAAGMHSAALEQATTLGERIAVGGEALFDASGMLNSQSSIGRDMHQMLRDSADGLLVEAQAAADSAKLRGETAAQQGEAAMSVMDSGQARLESLAAAAGVSVEQLQADWDGFFGQDWMLEATFTATADKFLAAQELANQMGVVWSQTEFEAFLSADDDPATITAAELAAYVEGQMAKQFQASLTAISPQAMSELAKVSATSTNWSNADYVAQLKSMDKTHPGIYDAVTAIANMTGGDYKAALKAINATAGGISLAKSDLAGIPPELVDILSQWGAIPPRPIVPSLSSIINLSYGPAPAKPVGWGVLSPGGYDGAILDGKSSPYSGRFPMKPVTVKAFANGGIENHNANIYKPSAAVPFRVFAEAETQGESYIPHAASKRKRSLDIWKETGKILGVDMAAFADGGMNGRGNGRSTTGGVTVNIDQMVNHSESTPDDFARSLFRKVRAAGALTPLEVI